MATRGQRWAYWLETALEERGWSRAEIAKRSATKTNGRPVIDASRVSEWLNKNESPRDPEILHEIARVLGVRVGVVLSAAGWLPDDELDLSSQMSSSGAIVPDVIEAIERDPLLLDDAKQHLRNQYELLLRLSPPTPARRSRATQSEDESIEERRERLRREHETRARRRTDARQHTGDQARRAVGDGGGGGVDGGGRGSRP